jgi:hypothetical protein
MGARLNIFTDPPRIMILPISPNQPTRSELARQIDGPTLDFGRGGGLIGSGLNSVKRLSASPIVATTRGP